MATTFARKHYKAVAEMLRTNVKPDLSDRDFARTVANFCDMFSNDNAAFDVNKFATACGHVLK